MGLGRPFRLLDDVDYEAFVNEAKRLLDTDLENSKEPEIFNTVTVHIDIRSNQEEDGFVFLMEADSVEAAREELEQLLLTD